MKLVKGRVTNFRSVEDSGDFDVSQLLCLVGKNEAGKTAILQALAGLNPHESTPIVYDVERDYPRRHLTEYDVRHKDEEAVVVRTEWELTEREQQQIAKEFGDSALTGGTVKVIRRYNAEQPEWTLPIDFGSAVRHLVDSAHFNASEKAPLGKAANSQELIAALKSVTSPTDKQQALLQKMKQLPGSTITGRIREILGPGLPRFMYFSHYDRMEGQLRLDTYAARVRGQQAPKIESGEQVFVDFLEYAGTSVDEINAATTYEGLNARCEAASNRITDQLLEYWTQNPNLEIEVRVTKAEPSDPAPFNGGVIARARVRNNLHKVTVPFSERSAGFIWFFSFLVKFARVRRDGGALVLLLDEPGLTLHGKAQADLLRYFSEKLVPNHQVIFSTHSPFMVPADELPSVRIVEDHILSPRPGQWVSEGTKVREDPLVTDRDTLFPLQGALGYEVTQTLFVGRNTLLVEGPSDLLYLQAFSAALRRRGQEQLDPRWTICPSGGLDKIQPFVSLFAGAKLNIAAVTDYARSDRRKMDSLRSNRILESDRLMTFASLLDKEEADVEDVFSPELYIAIVNDAFQLAGEMRLQLDQVLEQEPGTDRIVKKVEACFRVMPPDAPEFDHYRPAEWLFRNQEILDGDSAQVVDTLNRASRVFRPLNVLLRD
jgi:energy-coupling factor transporter ATP-binding protein EcfA2